MSEADAFVRRHKAESPGAIVIGKTNLDQFATGLVGVRTPYPVPQNALDPESFPADRAAVRALPSHAASSPFRWYYTAGSGRVRPRSTISWGSSHR